jgi:hypothetical protein
VKTALRTLAILVALGVAAFAFSPYRLGTLKDYRFMVYLKYWHIIPPDVVNPELLARNLASDDARVQSDAAQSIGLLPPHAVTRTALRQFIDRPGVEASAKDVAIWSLGELRDADALPQLRTRLGRADVEQENLRRAIDKIEGRRGHTFWPE